MQNIQQIWNSYPLLAAQNSFHYDAGGLLYVVANG